MQAHILLHHDDSSHKHLVQTLIYNVALFPPSPLQEFERYRIQEKNIHHNEGYDRCIGQDHAAPAYLNKQAPIVLCLLIIEGNLFLNNKSQYLSLGKLAQSEIQYETLHFPRSPLKYLALPHNSDDSNHLLKLPLYRPLHLLNRCSLYNILGNYHFTKKTKLYIFMYGIIDFIHFWEVKVLKRYLVTSIVVGAIFLTGCEKDDKAASPLSTSVDKQIIAMESVMAPVPLVLTLPQKEYYYKEYLAIVNKLNEEYGTGFKLDPITTFSANYWLELKDFEDMLKGRIDTSYVVADNKEVFSPVKVPKFVELHMGAHRTIIRVDGSFDTQLSMDIPGGRQLFSVMHSLSSKIEQGKGYWTQTGYDPSIKDHGSAYNIAIGGYYSYNGVSSPHIIEIEYYCNIHGGIT